MGWIGRTWAGLVVWKLGGWCRRGLAATAKVKVTLQANVGGPALALLLYKHLPLHSPAIQQPNGSLTHCACRLLRRPSHDLRPRHAHWPPRLLFPHSRGHDDGACGTMYVCMYICTYVCTYGTYVCTYITSLYRRIGNSFGSFRWQPPTS